MMSNQSPTYSITNNSTIGNTLTSTSTNNNTVPNNTAPLAHQISVVPRSISSGYESFDDSIRPDSIMLLPASFNSLMIRPNTNNTLEDQYNTVLPGQLLPGQLLPGQLLPGQSYTAPIMVVTKEQLDHHAFVQQQMNDRSHDRSHDNRQRQYSGPVIVTSNSAISPPNQNNDSGLQTSDINIPHRARNYQPPQLQTNVSQSFRPIQVTQSLLNFEQKPSEYKATRSASVGVTDLCKEQVFKREVKEKSLCEEEEECSTLLVGEDFGGYDYQFLVSSDDLHDITCPICQLVLCTPFLTTCCGAHFCRDCIAPLLRKHSPCPMCNNRDLQGIIDRRTERKINSLPVRCTKYDLGCTWTGTLTDLHSHLSPSTGNCGFVIVPCPLACGQDVPLSEIKHHQEEACPRRVHPCKFCNHRGIYEDMPQFHWPVCEGYPVPCPHECSINDMPRRLLNQHVLECPKRNVECCYSYAGCSIRFQGDEIQQHMEDNVAIHLNLLSGMVKKLSRDHQQRGSPLSAQPDVSNKTDKERNTEIIILNRKLNEKEDEILSLKGQFGILQEDLDETRLDVARMKSMLYNPPFEFKVNGYTDYKDTPNQWFSVPFYTHSNGYKMCMSVDCNGADEGEGTHVSVYANLMRGEFDDSLSWPFSGIITVQLYNHFSDEGNIIHDIPFRKSVPLEISGRILDQELAESGLGVPQFVKHNQLHYDVHTNVGYLKSDQLKFCVLKVKLNY